MSCHWISGMLSLHVQVAGSQDSPIKQLMKTQSTHHPHARSIELTERQPQKSRVAQKFFLDHSGMGSSGTSSITKRTVATPNHTQPATTSREVVRSRKARTSSQYNLRGTDRRSLERVFPTLKKRASPPFKTGWVGWGKMSNPSRIVKVNTLTQNGHEGTTYLQDQKRAVDRLQ